MFISHRSIFELTLDALPDGVLLTDRDRHVVYANQAFADLWGISAEIMRSGDETVILRNVGSQLQDPQAFFAEVERIHPTNEVLHDEVYFADGRILSRRSVPVSDEEQIQARIWIFTDVTEARFAREDSLTGVKNRRAFTEEFPKFVSNAEIRDWKSVALIDVDNFKKYNDIYGHSAGDQVLRSLGKILRNHLERADDLLFRIGGEEFLMARLCSSEMEAGAFFELVRRSVQSLHIVHTGNLPHGVVTASIGVCAFQGGHESDDVFNKIDEALYNAKAAGRNCLHIAALSRVTTSCAGSSEHSWVQQTHI